MLLFIFVTQRNAIMKTLINRSTSFLKKRRREKINHIRRTKRSTSLREKKKRWIKRREKSHLIKFKERHRQRERETRKRNKRPKIVDWWLLLNTWGKERWDVCVCRRHIDMVDRNTYKVVVVSFKYIFYFFLIAIRQADMNEYYYYNDFSSFTL